MIIGQLSSGELVNEGARQVHYSIDEVLSLSFVNASFPNQMVGEVSRKSRSRDVSLTLDYFTMPKMLTVNQKKWFLMLPHMLCTETDLPAEERHS